MTVAANALVELLLTEFCGCTMDDPEVGDYIAAMKGLADVTVANPNVVLRALIEAHGYGDVMDVLISSFKQEAI